MKRAGRFSPRALFAPLMAFLLTACPGPRPVVRSTEVRFVEGPSPSYEVRTIVENRGRGEGQARLKVKLVDQDTGRSYKGEASIGFEPWETVAQLIRIAAPQGRYRTDAQVEYPEM